VWPETHVTIAAMTSKGLKSRKNRRIAYFMIVRMRRRRSSFLFMNSPRAGGRPSAASTVSSRRAGREVERLRGGAYRQMSSNYDAIRLRRVYDSITGRSLIRQSPFLRDPGWGRNRDQPSPL
jgi:hypothetical protein